jgi:carboxypeptidase PM20D1
MTAPVAEMFDTLGRHSTFAYRMIFSNMWCFGWILDLLSKKTGGEMNALMRTTVAFTQMQGSNASNVVPTDAKMVSNIRINPHDTMESVEVYLKKTVNDPRVEVKVLHGMQPSRISVTDCEEYRRIESAVASTWRGSLVSPYLMVQCSDSRHYGKISDRVYRFSAMALTAEERRSIHGNNEKITLDAICKAVEFYIRLLKNS